MKKKVGELFGKPVVVGDKNVFTENEISLTDLLEGKLTLEDLEE